MTVRSTLTFQSSNCTCMLPFFNVANLENDEDNNFDNDGEEGDDDHDNNNNDDDF